MELHQIRYFLAVCDHGSFTRAAEFSYVSQPSLTHAIKKLEMELGGELFIRERSGCLLTPLGHMVEPNFRKILQNTLVTKADAIRFTRLNTVPLRVGIMTTVGAQRLNPCFARYQQDYPNIEFELIIDNDQSLLEQLESSHLDLVISPTELTLRPSYQTKLLYTERYVVAFGKTHRFNQLDSIDLKEIQTEPYLDRLNCELRENLREVCQNQEIKLYAAYRCNNEEWIVNLVRAGMGIALLPEYSIPQNCGDINWRYLVNPEINRKVQVYFLKQGKKQSAIPDFVTCLELSLNKINRFTH